jgi:predicted PurR-regulated permease PerM
MNIQSSNDSVYDITIRLLILLGIIACCVLIMFPFFHILLWSLILGIALYPLHSRLTKKVGGKPKLASFIIIFSIMVIIILPAGLLIGSLVEEVKVLKVSYDNGTLTIPPPSESVKEWPVIGEKLYDFWLHATDNIKQLVLKYQDQLLDFGKSVAKGILSATSGLIQIILSLLISGVLLVTEGVGDAVRRFFRKAGGNAGDEFADLTVKTIGSVVKGVIGESFVLALLFGSVFFLAGIPYAGIWTLLVFVLSVLQMPLIIVSIPVALYFFAVKEITPAIIWTIALFLVSLSNNFLTPLMLGKGAPVPMPVIFIGVIGGFMLSGFIGLFTGAIVMSIGYTLLVGWINTDQVKS